MHKGSLQYWPRRRARSRLPRLRSNHNPDAPCICNLVAYKAGMTHILMTDDSNSATKGAEVSKACTALELPETSVYGVRFYGKNQLTNYRSVAMEISGAATDKQTKKIDEAQLAKAKSKLSDFIDITALLVAHPRGTGTGQHHSVKFESQIGGKTLEEKFEFISGMLGKRVSPSDVFAAGEYVDVTSISTGKGWQGAIKRFGVSKQWHKHTGKARHVGPLGAFTPGKVLYTVPRAGQMGFNYRTEHNKRIIKIGNADDKITPSSGFLNYGIVRNDYVLLLGSLPGPAKRLVRVRKAVRSRKPVKEPQVSFVNVK